MRFIPSWAQAIELAEMKVQFSTKLPFISNRAMLVIRSPESEIVLLKILIDSRNSSNNTQHRDIIESALLRGGLIRSQHTAFTQLIDHRWTTFGLVTLNEYIQNSYPLAKLGCLRLDRLVNLCIRICDAILHIHQNSSFHGDISLTNIIVNDQDEIHIVDYDLADPVPSIFRTSYSTKQKYWTTLEARQMADIRSLELIVNLSCYQRKLTEQARTKRPTLSSKPLAVTA